jgi:hypothetical protein
MLAARCGYFALEGAGMFWLWLWLALTAGVMITSRISMVRAGSVRKREALGLAQAQAQFTIHGAAPKSWSIH